MVMKFSELAPTWVMTIESTQKTTGQTLRLRRLLKRFAMGAKPSGLPLPIARGEYDLIYSNTITNGEVLDMLAHFECPVITHVHELDHWIEAAGERNLEQVKRHTRHYIAASQAVRNNLIYKHGVDPASVEVVYEFIPIAAAALVERDRKTLRRRLALPEEGIIIVGSGHETWRKGKDLFVELCREVKTRKLEAPTFFLWVGGWESNRHQHEIELLVAQYGLGESIRFAGQVTNPMEYFAASDFFAMVSREDPYPLVCLEAAALGKPILCFAGSGGMPEFVETDAGIILPHLDVGAMAAAAVHLADNPDLCRELGETAKSKIENRHDVAIGGRQVVEVITKVLRQTHSRKLEDAQL